MSKLKEIKHFHKVKIRKIKDLFEALKSVDHKDPEFGSPNWIKECSQSLKAEPGLIKLLLKQIEVPYNKYSFYLPAFMFKVGLMDTYVKWLDEYVDFKVQDPTKYLKRAEWTRNGFIFYLSRKSSVKRFTKSQIKRYEETSQVLQEERAAP